ncbi:ABC transporter ATP-binding protein [Rhodococcus sp. NPDC003318]|uniref:ABC transporter ATP-binding protein n=1 Tax=Rhodococcus sp. NPDC003318 TaxID=3364503 RepID=UPI00368B0975
MTHVGTKTTEQGMALHLDAVTLRYDSQDIVRALTLDVRPGEILVLTGPSGCGKSTVLRGLAGLLAPASGEVRADNMVVHTTSRDRAMVFQDDALLPWRTVRANIELALRLRGVPRRERPAAAQTWIREVGLTGYGDYLPKNLSGGMRQRVQMARGLCGAPRAVMMDEPFGALDAQTRGVMQQLLLDTWAAHPTTVVFVTHDVDEAVLLGDRVAVLGRVGEPLRAVVDVPFARDRTRRDDPATRAARAEVLVALGSVGSDHLEHRADARHELGEH